MGFATSACLDCLRAAAGGSDKLENFTWMHIYSAMTSDACHEYVVRVD